VRAAIIVDGKVDNIIEVAALDALPGTNLVEAPTASIGDAWDGEQFTQPTAQPAPVEVPAQVTMRQARLALLSAGLLAQVDPAIESLDSPEKEMARIEWDYSSAVSRHRPLVVMLGQKLGLDDEALDQLFITAAGL
jgi:hypothetical protein